jgi:hypothetical protein
MAPMDAEDHPIALNSLIHFITFPKLRDICPAGALLTPTEKITELRSQNCDVFPRRRLPA